MRGTIDIISEDLIVSLIDVKHGAVVSVGRLANDETLGFQVCCGQLSDSNAAAEHDETCYSNEINMCKEFSQSVSLNAKVQKSLNKSNTFPVTNKAKAFSSGMSSRTDDLGEHSQSSSAVGNYYLRSVSLPSPSNLVSAMKGGRASHGIVFRSDLRVKWSPEVYDPPVTSMSHTVTGQKRPKAKKKDKQKHKGRSPRGSGNERKQGNRKCSNKTQDPQSIRLQGNGVVNGFGKSMAVTMFECGVNGQEVKCETTFVREALAEVRLPFGEAS